MLGIVGSNSSCHCSLRAWKYRYMCVRKWVKQLQINVHAKNASNDELVFAQFSSPPNNATYAGWTYLCGVGVSDWAGISVYSNVVSQPLGGVLKKYIRVRPSDSVRKWIFIGIILDRVVSCLRRSFTTVFSSDHGLLPDVGLRLWTLLVAPPRVSIFYWHRRGWIPATLIAFCTQQRRITPKQCTIVSCDQLSTIRMMMDRECCVRVRNAQIYTITTF